MFRSIWNSKSGMEAQMNKLDAISNNLANVGTKGYKKVDVGFEDLMQETLKRDGYPVSNSKDGEKKVFTGSGVKATGIYHNDSQGDLVQTNKKMDLAIDGKGYFKVNLSNGEEAYTRCGSFKIDAEGRVVDNSGKRLVIIDQNGQNINSQGSTRKFDEKYFNVDSKGYVSGVIDDSGNVIKNKIFKINIYNTIGQNSMKSIGQNLYVPETIKDEYGNNIKADVIGVKNSNIVQGFLENSNVDLGKEMSDMIITQRAFQLNSKALTTADEMWGMVNNLKGR
ncbi:flagellar hook-basal body complex protein [Clostridium aestuarii]|uniref:Flagellar hook-basal body complex protein n=1 Tax=Clostridium aestuarii TaxID=338193 RepID=A0ABT4CXI9_9CLOT|nr:flagellar hook-basal body complex protein [Clostridium aestuarii]MCY6483704.1 flagellar hook-basal body complex protein [Clostridium aestuarii]